MALGAALVAPARAAKPEVDKLSPTVVRDLHFGDALFYYYQGKDLEAITRLMAYQQWGRMPHHDAETSLLLGGLYLSLGLHNEAGDRFETLLTQSVPEGVRNRAWFYLGKVWYQRGYWAQAENALRKVEGELPAQLEAEKRNLLAQVLIQQGRFDDAIAEGGAELQAIDHYIAAVGHRPAGSTPLMELGLVGQTPDADLVLARDAFARGDLAASAEAADEAAASWINAEPSGQGRAFSVAMIVIAILFLMSLIVVTARREERARELQERYGVSATTSNAEAVGRVRTLVLMVKPQDMEALLEQVAPHVTPEHLVVSFAAGIHYCLGAPLARLEGEVVFERLLARFPDISGDTNPHWRPSLTLRGLETLQVSVR